MSGPRLIPLGVITTVHGIRGQVKIRSFTAVPDDITSYGPLTDKHGKMSYDITITSHTKDVLIATVKGFTTREAAEKLRGVELCVPRSSLPEADENEYYYEDLTGLKLLTKTGEAFGVIQAVHNFGAGDLLSVRLASGEEELFPFNRTIFPTINIQQGTAVIEPPVMVSDE